MIKDFFIILSQCISAIDSGALIGVVALALALGALCWLACSYYTKLWNKRFNVKLKHHLLCAFAAIMTIAFVITFQAVGKLEMIVDEIIDDWSEELLDDEEWGAQTYEIAFYAVKEDFPENFTGIPEPGDINSYIPVNNQFMMQICVEVYVNEACAHFSTQHPFLNLMLRANPGISEDEIIDDMTEYFRTHSNFYPPKRAIIIAAKHIKEVLLEQSPDTVWKTRLILVALFLLVQMIPFGVIGYYAYKDLKIMQYNKYQRSV